MARATWGLTSGGHRPNAFHLQSQRQVNPESWDQGHWFVLTIFNTVILKLLWGFVLSPVF